MKRKTLAKNQLVTISPELKIVSFAHILINGETVLPMEKNA
jgi:hypothetical protein